MGAVCSAVLGVGRAPVFSDLEEVDHLMIVYYFLFCLFLYQGQ
jgi:hypothetical protein